MAQDPMPDRSVPPLIVSHEQPSPYFAEPKRQPTGLSTPIEKPRSADLSEYREQAEFIPTTAGQHRSLLDVLKHWTLELISWVGCIIVIVGTVVTPVTLPYLVGTANSLLQLQRPLYCSPTMMESPHQKGSSPSMPCCSFLSRRRSSSSRYRCCRHWGSSNGSGSTPSRGRCRALPRMRTRRGGVGGVRVSSSTCGRQVLWKGQFGLSGIPPLSIFNLTELCSNRFLPRLAAVVMVSSALTGPITQQVLNTTLVLLPARNGTMAMASRATTLSRGKTPNGSVNLSKHPSLPCLGRNCNQTRANIFRHERPS